MIHVAGRVAGEVARLDRGGRASRQGVGLCDRPDDLLVHHFSLGSRASRTAFALPCRMALIYHNITPPEYFLGVHPQLVRQCFHGRRELLACRSRCEIALGDSEFNRQELEALGFPRTDVLPVVPDFTHLDVAPDARVWLFGR